MQYLPAHGLAAGEKDEVKLLIQQGGVLPPAAGDYGHVFRREAAPDQLLQQRGRGGGVGAGLHHGSVPRRDGVGQRVQGQQHRIVPRAHNQGVPVWRRRPEAPGGKLGQRRVDGARPSQAAGVPDHVAELGAHQPRFAHKSLISALSQVGGQGRPNLRLMAVHRVPQPAKHFDPEGHRQRGSGLEKPALAFHDLVNIHIWPPIPQSRKRSEPSCILHRLGRIVNFSRAGPIPARDEKNLKKRYQISDTCDIIPISYHVMPYGFTSDMCPYFHKKGSMPP